MNLQNTRILVGILGENSTHNFTGWNRQTKKSVELIVNGGPACELFSRLSSSIYIVEMWNCPRYVTKCPGFFLWTDFSLGHQISTNIYIYTLSLYIQNTYIVEFICICMYFLFILKSKFPTTVATSKPRRKLTPSKWIWWSHQKSEKIWWCWCFSLLKNGFSYNTAPLLGADFSRTGKTTAQPTTNTWFFGPQEHLLPDQRGQFRHRFGWQVVDLFRHGWRESKIWYEFLDEM